MVSTIPSFLLSMTMRLPAERPPVLVVVGFLLILILVFYVLSRKRDRTPLPPSPPGLPIVGHYLDVLDEPWITFKNWADQFGSDVISLNMMGTPMIILNSFQSVRDVFDKRSSVYSDRHPMPMMTLIGWMWSFAFQRYGTQWRNDRKVFKQSLSTSNYQEHEIDAVRGMVKRMAETPEKWEWALRHMAGDTMFRIAYGIDIKPENDPFVEHVECAMRSLALAGNFGSFVIDIVPSLNYLPSWFPGLGYRKKAIEWSQYVLSLPDIPFEHVKANMSKGTVKPSIAFTALEELQGDESAKAVDRERSLRNVLGTMYAGGAETTVSSVGTFVLAIVQNPDIFRKGRAAIDRVVGPNRLPEFSDQESLPYIQALVQETLRWKPVAPLGIAHAASADDIYNGYRIPKGSVVVGNLWAILQDESLFGPNTDRFIPERFLNEDGSLNLTVPYPEVAFGFGRRICPGKDMAADSVWISIATILATLDVTKAKDKNGYPIEPSGKYINGLVCVPEHFPCDIRFRSSEAEGLIKDHVVHENGQD